MSIVTFSPLSLFLTAFMPHGTCYLWKPYLVGLHLGSNAIIALSYFSIPLLLIHLVRKRRDLPFNALFFLSAGFIVSCGMGHLMDIWTLWYPNYWTSGIIRAITAVISFITALSLINLTPQILAIPSPAQLEQEIEERKRAEIALKNSQKKLTAIFNQTFQLMGLINPDGTIISLNQTALDFLGLKAEQVEKMAFDQLSAWQSPLEIINKAIKFSATHQLANQQELSLKNVNDLLVTFDFSFKPLLDESGKVELIIAEGRDISARKQAEAKLQQLNHDLEIRVKKRTKALEKVNQFKDTLLQRERIANAKIKIYEDIVLSIPVGLTIWHLENLDDLNSFRLIDINPMGMEILQLNREQHLNQLMKDCFPNIWSYPHLEAVQMYAEVVRTQTTQWMDDVVYDDSRIGQFHFDVKAFPLPNQCLGIAFEDVTSRRRAELALQERALELSRLNTLLLTVTGQLEKRNQELDQFAYVTSHDLKAPLRAIANLSEWIEEDLAPYLNDETRSHLILLRGRVQRMENLINGLLEYSRVGRFQTPSEPVDVAILLQEVVDSLDLPSTFTFSMTGEMPQLTTEKIQLQQVFSNLISNAIKHHPRTDGIIEISCQEQEKYYQFSVKDDGDGIDPSYHQKIFEIFQTLTPRDQKESTGIGLSIVKKILDHQGGIIKVDSEVGKGAIFSFTWPKKSA